MSIVSEIIGSFNTEKTYLKKKNSMEILVSKVTVGGLNSRLEIGKKVCQRAWRQSNTVILPGKNLEEKTNFKKIIKFWGQPVAYRLIFRSVSTSQMDVGSCPACSLSSPTPCF